MNKIFSDAGISEEHFLKISTLKVLLTVTYTCYYLLANAGS
jgi:hypothetical protein